MIELVKHIKKLLKITTCILALVSIVTPFAYQMTQVFAQVYDVEMEIKYKDGSRQSIFKTKEALLEEPLPEIQPAEEMPEVETEFSIEQIQEIDEAGGVTYDRYYVASVDETKLKELGYTSQEIADIAEMVEFYNSFKVLSVRVIDLSAKREAKKVSLGVTASAACQYEYNVTFHTFHSEVYMNQCLIGDMKKGVATGDFVATVVALKFPVAIPVAIGLAGAVLYAEILDATSGQCGDEGANLNITNYFTNLITPTPLSWVSSVC
jgi:hypothetical protein